MGYNVMFQSARERELAILTARRDELQRKIESEDVLDQQDTISLSDLSRQERRR
jgi:hypothetical protein